MEGQSSRSFVPTDLSQTEAEWTYEDVRTSASPKRDRIRTETRSTTPATVKGHNSRSGDDTQVTETEDGAVNGVEEAEYVVSEPNSNARDSAHQPHRISLEPSAMTSSEVALLEQPQMPLRDEIEAEAVIAMPSSEASDIDGIRKPGAGSLESCDPHQEVQLHYGRIVSELHEMKISRDRRKREIAANRNALPNMKILEQNVEQSMQKVTELTRMLEEARQIAASASSAREIAINEIDEIEIARQKLAQHIADHKVLRTKLDNIID